MLSLQKFELKDISQNYLKWLKRKDIIASTSIKKNLSITEIQKYIRKCNKDKKRELFKIIYENNHVGNISYHIKNNQASIGLIIGEPKYRNKGIGTNAIKLIIKKLKKRKVSYFWSYINENNYGSIKAFKNNNFINDKKDNLKYFLNLKKINSTNMA